MKDHLWEGAYNSYVLPNIIIIKNKKRICWTEKPKSFKYLLSNFWRYFGYKKFLFCRSLNQLNNFYCVDKESYFYVKITNIFHLKPFGLFLSKLPEITKQRYRTFFFFFNWLVSSWETKLTYSVWSYEYVWTFC